MRVCFVSSYPPNRGRLSEYAQNLVKALAERPAVTKVYVLADKSNNSQERFMQSTKIEVLRIWKADDPLSIIGILWQILKLKPDITHFNVHFQSYGKSRVANFVGFSLVPSAKMFGLKTIVLLHNLGEKVDLQKVNKKSSLVNRTGILVATKLILLASSVVVTVRSYVQYLKMRYRHKELQYIPHGISVTNRPSTNHKEKKILMFGHMGPSKGLPTIFRAFESLTNELKDIRLIVAGDSHPNFPEYLNKMKEVAPSGVDFVGYVKEEDVGELFSAADVVVLPYLAATGTSGVFHLACGYGKPIVATSLSEIQELIKEGASALLVPPGDYKTLRKAISRILSDKSLTAKMVERNLIFARREQWSAVAEAYEKAYLRILNLRSFDISKVQVSLVVPSCETPKLHKEI